MWVVWDNHGGEYLFLTGADALQFINVEIRNRELSQKIRKIQEAL